jgi:hypothetical protein
MIKLTNLFCQAGIYQQQHTSSRKLDIARLLVRGESMLTLKDLMDTGMKHHFEQGWEDELTQWLNAHPARVDLAVPFLLYAFLNQKEAQMNRLAVRLYAHNPHDPVALWFTGLSMTGHAQEAQEGLSRMRLALTYGIERFMPIDPDIKLQLTGQGAPN